MSSDLIRHLVTRLAVALGMLAGLSFLVFAGVDLLPGDPVTNRLGDQATPERIAAVRDQLRLDDPLLVRYGRWVDGLMHGDLGTSLLSDVPVRTLLADRLGNSALLAGITVALVVPVSLGLGLWAGWRRGRWPDRTVSTGAVVLVAMPEYVIAGLLVLVFAVSLRWLPAVSVVPSGAGPLAAPQILVLPVLSLAALSAAHSARVIRAATAAALRAPYVDNARLNGVRERTILRRAVLPAVLPVAVQLWCVLAVGLVGGAILVEKVFAYPGIGELMVAAVQAGDLPVTQAMAILLGGATLVALTVTDVVLTILTPWKRAAG
jgi:peptide/nickel transport system permease protein